MKKQKPNPKYRYYYMCKNCWHSWTHTNKYVICPKCKSDDIDEEQELIL